MVTVKVHRLTYSVSFSVSIQGHILCLSLCLCLCLVEFVFYLTDQVCKLLDFFVISELNQSRMSCNLVSNEVPRTQVQVKFTKFKIKSILHNSMNKTHSKTFSRMVIVFL